MNSEYYKTKGYKPCYFKNTCNFECNIKAEECPNHPDLCLLRDAAADEREAIAQYLECAADTCWDKIFFDVTEDEMQHFIEVMRLITCLDPIQAKYFEAEKLWFMEKKRYLSKSSGCKLKYQNFEQEEVEVTLPDKNDIPAIACLTKAISAELHAINKYQRYMNQAQNPSVKKLFCKLMNEEKEHVAEFTSALFKITNEPLIIGDD